MIMRREGAPGPLKVGFWLGRDGKTGVGTPARRRAFDNVVRSALPLIGAVEDNRAILGRAKHYYASRDIVAACQEIAGGHLAPRDYLASLRGPLQFAAFAADDPLPGILDVPLALARFFTKRLPAALRSEISNQ